MNINYYEILGINSNATSEEIKSAYRSLSKKYHPDVNDSNNATAFFRLIKEAYDTLIDDEKRSNYDNPNSKDTGEIDSDNTYEDYEAKSHYEKIEHLNDIMQRIRQKPQKKTSVWIKLLTIIPILIIRTLCLTVLAIIGVIYLALYVLSYIATWIGAGVILLGIVWFLAGVIGSGFEWLMLWVLLAIVVAGVLIPIICKVVIIPFSIILNKLSGYTFSPFWY